MRVTEHLLVTVALAASQVLAAGEDLLKSRQETGVGDGLQILCPNGRASLDCLGNICTACCGSCCQCVQGKRPQANNQFRISGD